jgi:hypothetical protein
VTLKAKTVCESKFRNLTFVRNLEAHVIDEPPHLLGDDTAPNPSEAVLATLGSCLSVGLHANAVALGIKLTKIELELEGDINVTAVWGVGDLDPGEEARLHRHPRQGAPGRRRQRGRVEASGGAFQRLVAGGQHLRNPVNSPSTGVVIPA